MGWLTESKCSRCKRLRKACICANIARGHVKAAARQKVDARPHPCPKCGKTMRGGICPGAYC